MRLVVSGISQADANAIEKAIRAPADRPIELQGLVTTEMPPAASYPYGVLFDTTTDKPKFSNGSAWAHFGPSTAADLAFAPAGDIAADNVQAAIVELDTEKQARHANLTAFSGVGLIADRLPYADGPGTLALTTLTAFGRSLIDDANAAAGRATLGLGTASLKNTGASGDAVPLLNVANTWSATQTYTYVKSQGAPTFPGAATSEAYFYRDPGFGAILYGAGSTFDTVLCSRGGVACVAVPSGTTLVRFPSITTTASAANAHLDASNTILRSTSSRRYKTDIRDLGEADADTLLSLRPVLYKSLATADDPAIDHLGLIAEEVAEAAPWLVHYAQNEEGQAIPDGVQYERLTVLLLHVLKRAHARLKVLESTLAAPAAAETSKGA